MCVWVCALSSPACKDTLVEDVSPDVCASGKRWVGKLTGDEEMFPGNDCVGCHKAFDGPEMFAAGTIYGVVDEDGARTTASDCFGVEGVRVTITGADGTVFETVTNRAGNFFFEGRESYLAKPFKVVIEYTTPDGVTSREPMGTNPSYGGCANCHRPDAVPTPGTVAGGELPPEAVVQGVFPIFTGPLQP
jgi:hypothetical protein